MQNVTRLKITPLDEAKATPLELLRDFADSSSQWHFLERESTHYAEVKNAPAGVLRHRHLQDASEIDLAFVADHPQERSAFHLAVVSSPGSGTALDIDERQDSIATFANDFERYLSRRNTGNTLNVSTADTEAAAI